jgi:hypothetical protein
MKASLANLFAHHPDGNGVHLDWFPFFLFGGAIVLGVVLLIVVIVVIHSVVWDESENDRGEESGHIGVEPEQKAKVRRHQKKGKRYRPPELPKPREEPLGRDARSSTHHYRPPELPKPREEG